MAPTYLTPELLADALSRPSLILADCICIVVTLFSTNRRRALRPVAQRKTLEQVLLLNGTILGIS